MTGKKFVENLKIFKDKLEKEYLKNLSNLNLKFEDYELYGPPFSISNETADKINNIFIKSCSKWQVGDKFKKFSTVFYRTHEEIVESIVWEIYEIKIFWDSSIQKYKFTYYVIDANRNKYDQFPQKTSFDHLEDVDVNKNNIKTKYYFKKI